MGASERDKRTLPQPRAVLWDWCNWTGGSIPKQAPHPAILLEWRKVQSDGRPDRWEGLIVYASGGGEVAWTVNLRWVNAGDLTPS